MTRRSRAPAASALGRRRSPRLRPSAPARVDRPRRILGRAAADQPGAHDPARLRPAAPGRHPGQPPAGGRRRRARTGPTPTPAGHASRSSTRTSTSGWRRSAGSSAAAPIPACAPRRTRRSRVVAAAQRPDGYLNSFVQVVARRRALPRPGLGPRALLRRPPRSRPPSPGTARSATTGCSTIAVRAADHIDRELGAGRPRGDRRPPRHRDGPGRARPDHRRAALPRRWRPGCSTCAATACSATGRFGAAYWQDHAPVREAHDGRRARRAPALPRLRRGRRRGRDSATTDLLAAVQRRWHDMVRTRRYLTGGLGSRHRDEAFGDPYELPPDRAYAETCAAIASVMLAWRLLLATGEPRLRRRHRADDLQRRAVRRCRCAARSSSTSTRCSGGPTAPSSRHGTAAAQPWYACACCPPNLMRAAELVAAVPGDRRRRPASSCTSTPRPIDADAGRRAGAHRGPHRYPWDGRVTVTVEETPDRPVDAVLRVPAWCRSATLSVGRRGHRVAGGAGVHRRQTRLAARGRGRPGPGPAGPP